MTERTPEFLAQFRSQYGRYAAKPDHTKCARSIYHSDGFGYRAQCTRPNGHGPHGAWCRQHDPDAVNAKRLSREAANRAKCSAEARDRQFSIDCRNAIIEIADGHPDPRGLAQGCIDKREGR